MFYFSKEIPQLLLGVFKAMCRHSVNCLCFVVIHSISNIYLQNIRDRSSFYQDDLI